MALTRAMGSAKLTEKIEGSPNNFTSGWVLPTLGRNGMNKDESTLALGQKFLRSEIDALEKVYQGLDQTFSEVVQTLLDSKGTVILSGVGKSYFIAQKISSSMASTGTPSIAIHPVDALHGDMGRIQPGDVVIVLSNSGASSEVVEFVRAIQSLDVVSVAITCRAESAVANLCDKVIDLGPLEEACPMGVAPSTTSTAMLAVGDALTLTLVEMRGFTIDSFARNHPGGSLGKRLGSVASSMRVLDATAVVRPEQSVRETLAAIAEKRGGAAFVVDAQGGLLGIFTDGDVKRTLMAGDYDLSRPIQEFMTTEAKSVLETDSVEVALDKMRSHHINCLAVLDTQGILLGHLDIQDVA